MKEIESKTPCAWCGQAIQRGGPFGLKTRFHKKIDFEGEDEKCIPISIAHLDRQVPAVVRRTRRRPEAAGLDLTFRTCSHVCAQVLLETIQFEKLLFAVPRQG